MLNDVPKDPSDDAAILALGLLKLARLKALKNSVRNSTLQLSLMGKRLNRLRSTFWIPGPWNARGAQVPKEPAAGLANAAGLR